MKMYKLTFLREINRPRLSIYMPYLQLVSFIKAVNDRHAGDIADDIVKEHGFAACEVEPVDRREFKNEVNLFLEDEDSKG